METARRFALFGGASNVELGHLILHGGFILTISSSDTCYVLKILKLPMHVFLY